MIGTANENAQTAAANTLAQQPDIGSDQHEEAVEVWRYVRSVQLRVLQDVEAGKLEQSPTVNVKINGRKWPHLADTGSQVNTMSKETFAAQRPKPVLTIAKNKLMGYHGSKPIPTKG